MTRLAGSRGAIRGSIQTVTLLRVPRCPFPGPTVVAGRRQAECPQSIDILFAFSDDDRFTPVEVGEAIHQWPQSLC